jgi:hypothetical protein
VAFLIRIHIFEWHVILSGSKNGDQKEVFESDWIACSKYDDHSRFIGHNWGDPYEHLFEHDNLHFDN